MDNIITIYISVALSWLVLLPIAAFREKGKAERKMTWELIKTIVFCSLFWPITICVWVCDKIDNRFLRVRREAREQAYMERLHAMTHEERRAHLDHLRKKLRRMDWWTFRVVLPVCVGAWLGCVVFGILYLAGVPDPFTDELPDTSAAIAALLSGAVPLALFAYGLVQERRDQRNFRAIFSTEGEG